MRRQLRGAVTSLWLVAAASACAQQVCDVRSRPLSTPQPRFQDNGDGTVTDLQSHLMWMRCSAGQTWVDGSCAGRPERLSFDSAQDWAANVNRGSTFFFNDWRLPLLRELATITERQCENPRVNLAVFPQTPAVFYWTASARPSDLRKTFAFALSFGPDNVEYRDKDEPNPVRLVRDAR